MHSALSFSQSFHMNLYPEGQIPNYKDVGEKEIWDTTNAVRVSKIQVPDIQVFRPSNHSVKGPCVIICPGGGYHILSYTSEGEDIAKFWNSKGVVAVVLKNRLPSSDAQIQKHLSPLMDAQRAIRMARYHAKDWGIDPEKIGIMGFSAGGHLASSASTHFDMGNASSSDPIERMSCRPDFSMLIYPVITMTEDFQHKGSRKALVGDHQDLMTYFSSEKMVTENTPPAILIHASDDKAVPVENSIVYYQALISHKVKAAMHIFSYGGHGFSLAIGKDRLEEWPELCNDWLKGL